MKMIAILLSSHQEMARLYVDTLESVCSMAGNPTAEDLLRVIDTKGKMYWCDKIEFVIDTVEMKDEDSEKAKQFIKDCTRTCSNTLISISEGKKVVSHHEWLTPEQALRAVEIATGK